VNPILAPMAATSGGLGLFTVETGDTLPRGAYSFEAGVNKFSRDPGSVTIFELGWGFGYGITDRMSFIAQFDPHRHTHIDGPGQLSLDLPPADPLFGNTIYRILPIPGARPMYVEDFPFAARGSDGVGDFDLGLKYGFLSERRGDRASLAIRADVFIATRTGIITLASSEAQNGATDFQLGLNLGKTMLSHRLIATSDLAYRLTRDPAAFFNNSPAFTRANQLHAAAGFLIFPEKRFQFLSEYTATVFVGSHPPDMTFGPRDPVDGVWGTRVYLTRYMALDAGYRWMLNLHNVLDRNGFVVKLGVGYWPERNIPPPSVSIQVAANLASVTEGSGEKVSLSARAVDSENLPLTYSWRSTAGSIIGTGQNVLWDSTGAHAGTYSINAFANDDHGGGATNSVQVRVDPKPFPPPAMSCSVDRSNVLAGEKVNVSAQVNDQSATTLTYQWLANGGKLSGTGSSVELDTTGLWPAKFTVTGRVDNATGGAANCSASVTIESPPPQPQASKINECVFSIRSVRLDNVCKRVLDDVAVRLANDPKARVVVIGYASPLKGTAQRVAYKLAMDRAVNAKLCLSSMKGVDASRIEISIGGGSAAAGKENSRVDIVWVPEGATY
jgi:outer membrane protein OmpA-like peptidoglycan-associated protein